MTKKLITRMNKNRSTKSENDITHALQLKLHERMNKSRFEVLVTPYGCNKNRDDEIKETKRRPIIAPAITVRLLKYSFKLF